MIIAKVDSIKQYLSKVTKTPSLLVVGVLLVLLIAVPLPAMAGVASFFAGVILYFAQFLGKLTLIFIGLLVEVAQYNDFINAPAVQKGWVVMRDIVNMFFIVILLMLAFGTVFRVEHYQYKGTLSKVLIMAVLVNFSKSITGFVIDVGQVVMLTFVNGFKEAAAGNFINGFGLDKMFQFAENNTEGAIQDEGAYFYAALLALITIAITTVVVGVYLIIFMLRIAVLWLLVITSPLAFLASAFPGESKLKAEAAKWWDYFGRYVTTGPLLAFFLWLSLSVMQFGNSALGDFVKKGSLDQNIPAAAITQIGGSEVLLSFIINIVLLLGGLYMAQQMGVAGGSLAAGALQGIQKAGLKAGAWAAMRPLKAVQGLGGYGFRKLYRATGMPIFYWPEWKKQRDYAKEERKRRDIQIGIGKGGDLLKTGRAGMVLAAGSADWRAAYGAGGFLNRHGLGRAWHVLKGGKTGYEEVHKEMEKEQEEAYVLAATGKQETMDQRFVNKYKGQRDVATAAGKDAKSGLGEEKENWEEYDRLRKLSKEDLNKEPGARQKLKELGKAYEGYEGPDDHNEKNYRQLGREYLGFMKGYEYNLQKYESATTDTDRDKYRNAAIDKQKGALVRQQKMNKLQADGKVRQAPLELVQAQSTAALAKANTKLNAPEKERHEEAQKEFKAEMESKDKDAQRLAENKMGLNVRNSKMGRVEELLADLVRLERERDTNVEGTGVYVELVNQITAGNAELDKLKKEIKDIDEGKAEAPEEARKANEEGARATRIQARAMRNMYNVLTDPAKAGEADADIWTAQVRNNFTIRAEGGVLSTGEKVKGKANEARDLAREQEKYAMPATFYAEQARRILTAEEMKKITTDNYHELIAYFRQAQHEKDPVRLEAILRKLANDYNDNEVVNALGYTSDFDGFRKFFEGEVRDKGGMSDQQMLGLANDISYINEGRHHWEVARITGHEGGKFRWFTPTEHVLEATAEIRKLNPRDVARSFNRLAYGGEKPNADGSRSFVISPLGVSLVANIGNELAQFISRAETNPNIVVNMHQAMKILEKIPDFKKIGFIDPATRQFKPFKDWVEGRVATMPAGGELDQSVQVAFSALYGQ